jgi:hypothetical protein
MLDKDHRLKVNVFQSTLADLAPLRGLPIKDLRFSHTKVRDLTPLRGMPLAVIHLGATPVRDVSPLADYPELEEIVLPAVHENVERLRPLPKLRYISTDYNAVAERPAQTAEEFWKEYDAKHPASPK